MNVYYCSHQKILMDDEQSQHEVNTTQLSEIDEQFAGLAAEMTKFTLAQLTEALSNLCTHKSSATIHEVFFTNDMNEILAPTSLLDLISKLTCYWSFINFRLLEYILTNLNSEMQAQMDSYISCLSQLKITHLPLLLHPDDKLRQFCPDPVILEMREDFMQDENVSKLLNVVDAILITFYLESQSVIFKQIDKVKEEIHLLFVLNAIVDIRQLLNSSNIHLKDQKINKIRFRDEIFQISWADDATTEVLVHQGIISRAVCTYFIMIIFLITEKHEVKEKNLSTAVAITGSFQSIDFYEFF